MRSWIAIAAGAVLLASIVPLLQHRARAEESSRAAVPSASASPAPAHKPPFPPPLSGIDLARLRIDGEGATAPGAQGRVAHLSLAPSLQRATQRILSSIEAPEAGAVLLDTTTGRVLVWASHVKSGPGRDLCGEATAPAASVFK